MGILVCFCIKCHKCSFERNAIFHIGRIRNNTVECWTHKNRNSSLKLLQRQVKHIIVWGVEVLEWQKYSVYKS